MHRTRLFAQHLPYFAWKPIILTVDEKYYEEELDWNLYKMLPGDQQIEKVKAFPITKPRLIGDIGLRAFFQLRRKALAIVRNEKIDFVYIPIPSFYVSLIGPYLHRKTGVKFGIDYIDPWVHQFPGSDKVLSRHWWSTKLARWLEPKAIKSVSLITGVAEGYYKGVQERNLQILDTCVFGAMPYGGEETDHESVKNMRLTPYLFQKGVKLQFVYAGAMLPKAYGPLEAVFKAIQRDLTAFSQVEFHFIGTGNSVDDPFGFNIRPIAEQYGLWQTVVFEYPARIPYLDVLVHLEHADGIFILGSTEPHYTPSKVYQGVLSKKPILAVLHNASSAVQVMKSTNIGIVLGFDGEQDVEVICKNFIQAFKHFIEFKKCFRPGDINLELFKPYSAREVTAKLVKLLERATKDEGISLR